MVYLTYTFISLFITEGNQDRISKQGRNLDARAVTEAMEVQFTGLLSWPAQPALIESGSLAQEWHYSK